MGVTPAERETLLRELRHLYPLAETARQAGQYVAEQPLRERILLIAERLGDLGQLLPARYYLAGALRLQGKWREALPLYGWITGLAADPVLGPQVPAAQRWYVAAAFARVATLVSALNEGTTAQVLAVLDDGLAWIDRIGNPELAAVLRMDRARIYERLTDWDAARRDLEIALSLRRRYPAAAGYAEASHLVALAALDAREEVGAYAEAIALVEDARERGALNGDMEARAIGALARARSALGDAAGAQEAAQEAVVLALGQDSPSLLADSYDVLGEVCRRAGRLDTAAGAAAGRWRAACVHHCPGCTLNAVLDGVRARLAQARAAQSELTARRYLAGARRLLARAASAAAAWDAPTGRRTSQDEVDSLAADADRLGAALAAPPRPPKEPPDA